MSFENWTFVQRESARIPRNKLDKATEAAYEESQEEAAALMDNASDSLHPLRFQVKRPETDYEGDSPDRDEPWAGTFTTTISAEADASPLMEGDEVVDRKSTHKIFQTLDKSMKRRGLKGDVTSWPADTHEIQTEFEGEDRRRGVEQYVLLEHAKGKFHLYVRVEVKVGMR